MSRFLSFHVFGSEISRRVKHFRRANLFGIANLFGRANLPVSRFLSFLEGRTSR